MYGSAIVVSCRMTPDSTCRPAVRQKQRIIQRDTDVPGEGTLRVSRPQRAPDGRIGKRNTLGMWNSSIWGLAEVGLKNNLDYGDGDDYGFVFTIAKTILI